MRAISFPDSGASSSFLARYPGVCGSCDDRIHEGDEIRMEAGVAIHADCDAPSTHERAIAERTCTRCFLVKPLRCFPSGDACEDCT
jgi:hypothetical protein